MKNETISNILTLTGKEGNPKYFDKLSDLSEQVLVKYLKVTQKLKNAL